MVNKVAKRVVDMRSVDDLQRLRRSIKKSRRNWKQYRPFVEKVAKRGYENYMKPMMRELRETPPPPNRMTPVNWASDRQKNYMMWMWRNKKIRLPHERSDDIPFGWKTEYTYRQGRLIFRTYNTERHAIYVVGKVGLSESRARQRSVYEKPIQPFHKDTGWKPAHTIVRPYYQKLMDDMKSEISEWAAATMNFNL